MVEPMKMAAATPSSWEELPEDLFGLVLLRLPSLADRVHLRAVCRPWRAGAQAQRQKPLPQPLPWLALRDGSLVDLDGAPVRCAPILRHGVDFGYLCNTGCDNLAFDNLAFVVHADGACSLMNPLSGLTLPLHKLAPAVRRALDESPYYDQSYIRKTHVKALLSSPLDSTPGPLVAVLVLEGNSVAVSACKKHDAVTINLCPEVTRGSTNTRVADIAFLHGKLYALTEHEGLSVMVLDASHLSKQVSTAGFAIHQCIAGDPEQQEIYTAYQKQKVQISFDVTGTDSEFLVVMRYLAESSGRLLMVRRWMSYPPNARLGDHDKTFRFNVFEADLTTIPGQWTKVESLGDQALFISSECSESVIASQCSVGVLEDCIYFMHRTFDNPSKEFFGPCVNPLGDSGVYNMRDWKITMLLPEAVMGMLQHKWQFLTWFFPADA